MPSYTVTAVSDQVRDWTAGQGGAMKSYRVHLDTPQGPVQNVEWSKKATSNPPTVGETVEGALEDGKYGQKLKVAFQPRGGGGGPRETHPRDAARMGMSKAIDQALKYLEIKAMTDKLKDDFKPGDVNTIAFVFAGAVTKAGDAA